VYHWWHANYPLDENFVNDLPEHARPLGDDESDTVVEAILGHFGSLMRNVAGWHATDFLGLEVTMSQAKCLYVVALRPGIGMSALAEQLGVGLSSTSGLVDRMVEHGYLERREDPADRRQQQVLITASGAAVVERTRELNAALLKRLLAGLTSHQLESLREGVAALDYQARTINQAGLPTAPASLERTPA
jgi:DNA-binding MarR family transcriptional regulator